MSGCLALRRSFWSHESQSWLTRVFTKPNHLFAFMQSRAGIELQNTSSDFSDIGQWSNNRLLQNKMFCPTIQAWVEKASELTRCRDCSNVASFVTVAES